MARSKILHVCPNISSVHLSLRAEVDAAGFDPDVLRTLLWLINAHDRLIAFVKISQNIRRIFEVTENYWGITTTDFQLGEIIPVLQWINQNSVSLEKIIGTDFNRQPKYNKDHPVMSRGSSRHPFYTTLWNNTLIGHGSETGRIKDSYLLLQGHLLFAHANEFFSKENRDEYENYGGQTEWKGITNSPYPAALSVRELSEVQYAEVLRCLPVHLNPREFASALNKLPKIEDSYMLGRIERLRSFLQKSTGLRKWVHRSSVGGQGGGASHHVTGYIDLSPQLRQQAVVVGDNNDPDYDWGHQSIVIETELDKQEQQELLANDLLPEEFASQELLLIGYESEGHERQVGSYSATSAEQARHIIMANQLLPWSFGELTITELVNVLTTCFEWVKISFAKDTTPSPSDVQKLEAICLLHVMLYTGSSFERARKTLVLAPEIRNEDADLAFLVGVTANEDGWRIRAIQPDYKSVRQAQDSDTERKRVDYLTLPDIGRSHRFVLLLQEHQAAADCADMADISMKKYRLFRRRPDTMRENLKSLLLELDPLKRLTETKLSKLMFWQLLEKTDGDVCAASMIVGDEHTLAHVRLFYSVMSVEYLQKSYIKATREMIEWLSLAINWEGKAVVDFNPEKSDRFLGSRLCPKQKAVKGAILKLKGALFSAQQRNDFLLVHNLHTLFMVWRFVFATACRAIVTPYLALSDIDRSSGIGLLTDKDDGTGYKSRLIWLPPTVIRDMAQYEQYRLAFLKSHTEMICKDDLAIFFVELDRNEQLRAITVSPKTMLPIMEAFLPSYPANFHRRFLRMELLERGCPTEIVDAWMGHWHMGEEPWATLSSFSFQIYRDTLQQFLLPLLDEIGFGDTVNLPLGSYETLVTTNGS